MIGGGAGLGMLIGASLLAERIADWRITGGGARYGCC